MSGASHVANKQSKIPIIQGELAPLKNIKADGNVEINTKLPLILITAHMETFGLVNVSCLRADDFKNRNYVLDLSALVGQKLGSSCEENFKCGILTLNFNRFNSS